MKNNVRNRTTTVKPNTRFYLIFIIIGFVVLSLCSYGQSKCVFPESTTSKEDKIVIVPEFQILKSTHGNLFTGASLSTGYYLNPTMLISIGAEYSYAPMHVDNGWDLFNLRMIPVFIDGKFFLTRNRKVSPYFQISQGVSFIHYRKEDQLKIFTPYMVSEKGYYVYGGAGVSIRILNKIPFFFGVGIKSFHLSNNELEVNPHGISFRFGLRFQ